MARDLRLTLKGGLMAGPIRAVVFDAVGTVMYAMPSVTVAYCDILGKLSGHPVNPDDVRSVLSRCLASRSHEANLTTDEASERKFWFDLVAELVPDAARQQSCFQALYDHFADPRHWRCYDDVEAALLALEEKNLKVLIASNFDERLHSVCAGLQPLRPVTDRIVSSEIGWRKPAREFFEVVCRRTQCRPEEILFVGDDRLNDIQGARLAGMPAAWIDRRDEPLGGVDIAMPPKVSDKVWKIRSLQELV